VARRVAWAEAAWRDLERIGEHIAEDSPGYAAAFVRRVRDRARSLEEMGERGRIVPELNNPAVRELVVGSYLIVLALIHGARDLPAMWDDGTTGRAREG
jgi:toxin ParE1/3/4